MIDRRRVDETLASAATGVSPRRDLRASQVADVMPDEIARPRRSAPIARVAVLHRVGRTDTLRAMLASPDALQQAILLTEILSPPKSRQRMG